MSRRKALFVGVPVIGLLAAASAILLWPVPASIVTISVAATPGTKITGNYEVDGVTSQIDTEAPMQIVATGREVTCWIKKDDQPSEISVKIAVKKAFASATAGPGQGVNVGFRRRGNWLTRSEAFWANTSRTPGKAGG